MLIIFISVLVLIPFMHFGRDLLGPDAFRPGYILLHAGAASSKVATWQTNGNSQFAESDALKQFPVPGGTAVTTGAKVSSPFSCLTVPLWLLLRSR